MMNYEQINIDIAIEALKDQLNKSITLKNSIARIQREVADYYKINVDDFKSKKRNASINMPRQIAMYLCRILTDESYPRIGIEFGGRDHSTVIHAFDKISEELKNNTQLKNVINIIKEKI